MNKAESDKERRHSLRRQHALQPRDFPRHFLRRFYRSRDFPTQLFVRALLLLELLDGRDPLRFAMPGRRKITPHRGQQHLSAVALEALSQHSELASRATPLELVFAKRWPRLCQRGARPRSRCQ